MASDETMTFHSSLQDEEDFDDDLNSSIDDGFDHHQHHQLLHHPHPHNLSRLSVCTSSTLCGEDDDDDDVDNAMTMYVSRLSLESFEDGDGDADGELSDNGKEEEEGWLLTSESEKSEVVGSCYSLPSTPPRRRNSQGVGLEGRKEYASENEAEKGREKSRGRRRRRRRVAKRERWMFERGNSSSEKKEESDQSGVVVITRPKGGKRSLCMGLEEVKACRELGFELEHERMLEMPSRISFSNETTSSGGNSPIANWRISGPGDHPRDVKARLKVWAQAVALASASKYAT